jgi:hypothetical protein
MAGLPNSSKKVIISDKDGKVKLKGGSVIINKKATEKHWKKLSEINQSAGGGVPIIPPSLVKGEELAPELKSSVTTDGSKGGMLDGKAHYDENGNPLGGIKAVVEDANGKQVELEAEEAVINPEAVKKHWKELSKINQSAGNGVPILPPNGAIDEDPDENYSEGGNIIEFNANNAPNKWIVKYAKEIKTKHPEIWDLAGNIFGNEAFKNLERVRERGYWLDSEEWMYKKWQSYVARHKKDFRLAGVVAMLKWCDKVEKGWAYMKNMIEAEIVRNEKRKTMKLKKKVATTKTVNPKKKATKPVEEPVIKYGCLMLDLDIPKAKWNSLLKLIDEKDFSEEKEKPLEREPHITVLYGFHDEVTPEIIEKELEGVKAPKFQFSKVSVFNNELYDILKFEIESKDLHALNKKFSKLPHTNKFPDYKPHSTIAYLKKGTANKYIKKINEFLNEDISSNEFMFSDAEKNKTYFPIKQKFGEGGNVPSEYSSLSEFIDGDFEFIKETEKAILIKLTIYKNKETNKEYLDIWIPKYALSSREKTSTFVNEALKKKNDSYLSFLRSKGIPVHTQGNRFTGYHIKPVKTEKIIKINHIIKKTSFPKNQDFWLKLLEEKEVLFKKSIIIGDKNQDIVNDIESIFKKNRELLIATLFEVSEKYPNLYLRPYNFDYYIEDEKYFILTNETPKEFIIKNISAENVKAYEQDNNIKIEQVFLQLKDIKFYEKKSTFKTESFEEGGNIKNENALEQIIKITESNRDKVIEMIKDKALSKGEKFTQSDRKFLELSLVADLMKAVGKYIKPTDKIVDIRFRNDNKIQIVATIARDGVNHSFITDWIEAGGYNIQSFHYRYIVKTSLDALSVNPFYDKFKEKIKALTKIQRLEKDLADNERRIKRSNENLEEAFRLEKLSDSELEKEARQWENSRGDDSWKQVDITWETIVERGADKNYDYSREKFENSRKEYKQSLINHFLIMKGKSKSVLNSIKEYQKEKAKIEAKIKAEIENSQKFEDGGNVNPKDSVNMDIPLMIRLLELAREDIKSDKELHDVAERLVDLRNKKVLTMEDYDFIAGIKQNKKYKELESNPKYALGANIELLAPNGNPSNLTPTQYKLVRTQEFKAWFGDWENDPKNASKVVDLNGEPMVCYHGSEMNFNVFEKRNRNIDGFFFSSDKETSRTYGENIYEVFLKIENPFFLDANHKQFNEDLNIEVIANYPDEEEYTTTVQTNSDDIVRLVMGTLNGFWKVKDAEKYDGVFLYNFKDQSLFSNRTYSQDTFVAFKPNQIKLADGTNTTFDTTNPDIRFEQGGKINELVENVSTDFLNSIRNQDKSSWDYDLEKSIEEQGILEPVTIGYWSEYDKITLVDGHHRLDTAIDLGIKSIPTIIQIYHNNPIGKHRLHQAPKYNPNAKKPSDLGIFNKGGIIAPNGQPSNLTPEQYKLVRTPEFKAWFGDWEHDPKNASKVVDSNGEPLVCYHGSKNKFNVFKEHKQGSNTDKSGELGFFFTANKNIAKEFYSLDGKLFEVFVDIKNPKEIKSKSFTMFDDYKEKKNQLIEEGNDGCFILPFNKEELEHWISIFGEYGASEYTEVQFVTFKPNQIKLADGTNTTFDTTNPDIRFEKGGKITIGKNEFKLQIYLAEHSYDNETGKETPMWFSRVIEMNGQDVDGILTVDEDLEDSPEIGCFDSKKKLIDFISKYKDRLNVIILDEDYGKPVAIYKHSDNLDIRFKDGGNISKTKAPLKERISGSDVNDKNSSSDSDSAKGIAFDQKTITAIQNKIDEHNEEHPDKRISLAVAKAVVRRGMGAYSSSHRPTISDGQPNNRVAWGLARLKAFLYKAIGGKSKSGKYSQDNDLLEELEIRHSKFKDGGNVSKVLLAPNGQVSNLTPEQYKLVRSPEFKAWFGDWENDPKNASKIIDANGEPKVIYHKTPNEFYEFTKDKYIWTADSLTYFDKLKAEKFKKQLSFFGNSREVLDLTPLGDYKDVEVLKQFLLKKGIKLSANRSRSTYAYFTFNEITRKQLQNSGYDCVKLVIAKDFNIELMKLEKEYIGYIFLDSNQIKLADGTNTTFEITNPDIRFEEGGSVRATTARFKPTETITFNPPLVGKNGNKLVAYTWKYEYGLAVKDGEDISKRFSDWSQAEISAETGRDIVHVFDIMDTEGKISSVSSESVPVALGFITLDQKKTFSNLATASKTLAKQQLQLAILKAEYEEWKKVRQEIIDAGFPEITYHDSTHYNDEDDIIMRMGDAKCLGYKSEPKNPERTQCVTDGYIGIEMNKRGKEKYFPTYKFYDLEQRIKRQEKKVQNIIKSNEA